MRFKSFRHQDIVQSIFHHLVKSPFHNLPEDEASQIANTCIKGGTTVSDARDARLV